MDRGELSVLEYALALAFGALVALAALKVLWDRFLRHRVWSTVLAAHGETIGTA
jgi:hypothetical protein